MSFKTFNELGLSDNALYAVSKKGFEEPTDVQIKTIPLLLNTEKDIIVQAQTGTGKTAAFALPLIDLIAGNNKHPVILILTPTRELAVQVAEEFSSLRGRRKINVLPVYGGQSIEQQIRKLKRGTDIIVGTPGRVLDHIKRKTLRLGSIRYFILDEADEMLNMGFIEDVETILASTDHKRRVMMFSATMPLAIRKLASKYMKDPEMIAIKDQLTTELTEQIYFEVERNNRLEALSRIIDMEKDFYGLIFCRTKVETGTLAIKLADRGYIADALHGDISQFQREKILSQFRKRRINILVATDVAARGIDITELSHVINYSLPQNPESYVHRIGRTGRAGKEGIAVTFISRSEFRKLLMIKRIVKTDIKKGVLPGIDAILDQKRKNIKEEIEFLISKEKHSNYMQTAEDLMKGSYEPKLIIAGLLRYALKDELNRDSYNNIEQTVDSKGTARLFIALGKQDKMDKRKLIDMICKKANINNKDIRDVSVLDKFSFMNVPFESAEIIINAFRQQGKGKRSLIARAKAQKRR